MAPCHRGPRSARPARRCTGCSAGTRRRGGRRRPPARRRGGRPRPGGSSARAPPAPRDASARRGPAPRAPWTPCARSRRPPSTPRRSRAARPGDRPRRWRPRRPRRSAPPRRGTLPSRYRRRAIQPARIAAGEGVVTAAGLGEDPVEVRGLFGQLERTRAARAERFSRTRSNDASPNGAIVETVARVSAGAPSMIRAASTRDCSRAMRSGSPRSSTSMARETS